MKKNKKGFTLIELLAVIVILGIIITIVVSNVVKYINQAKEGSFIDAYKVLVKNMQTELMSEGIAGTPSVKQCADDGSYTKTVGGTTTKVYCSGIYDYDKTNLDVAIDASGNVTVKGKGNFKNVKLTTSNCPLAGACIQDASFDNTGKTTNTIQINMDSDGKVTTISGAKVIEK